MDVLNDWTLWSYISISLFSYITLCLFVWDWTRKWVKRGSIGHVYFSVGITMAGIVLHYYMLVYGRIGSTFYDFDFLHRWYWKVKDLFIVIGTFLIMITMIYRMFLEKFVLRKGGFSHFLNPLHIYCRLRDLKIANGFRRWIVKKYEKIFKFFSNKNIR